MEPTIGKLDQVSLIGYVSTISKSNAEEEETITQELIDKLLAKWENISGVQDECLYMMWTWDNDLEGTDEEEMFVGVRVSDESEASDEMIKKTLSSGGYAVYSVNPSDINSDLWTNLYKQLFSEDSGLEEAAPFLLQRHINEEQVDIYIPVKETENS